MGLEPPGELICLVYAGGKPDAAKLPDVQDAEWHKNGEFVVRINGETVSVPPLP